MLLINHKEIVDLNITKQEVFSWVEECLSLKHNTSTILPHKHSMKPIGGDSFINVMPCVIGDNAGVKLVTRYPNRKPSLDAELLLLDKNTGEMKALMSADYITTMRTGAVAVHSIKLLARKDFKVIGVMGLGCVTHATFDILFDLYPNRELTIKVYKYKDQHAEFINRYSKHKNLTFIICDTYEDVIRDSDVIVSGVTYFEDDICKNDDLFKKGCLLIPIHTRGFSNCDLFFDKVFGDDIEHIRGFKNFNKFKYFAEVADIVDGTSPGRENDDERIIAYNIGLAIHDIYLAGKIYDLLKDKNLQEISLEAPTEKMWL